MRDTVPGNHKVISIAHATHRLHDLRLIVFNYLNPFEALSEKYVINKVAMFEADTLLNAGPPVATAEEGCIYGGVG